MNNKYDVIIVGAGIGGLICGTKLAKNGLKVLIIEKHDKPGGCVTSSRKQGFNFDYGAHIFGGCNEKGVLTHFLKELNVKDVDLIRLNPTERFIFPDQVIEVPQDIEEYIDMLSKKYPKEASKIRPFFKKALTLAHSFSSDLLLSKYKELTYEKLLREYFDDEKLMSILSGQFWYLGLTPKYLAATAMCLMTISYLRDGTYYPRGGPTRFSSIIAETFKEYGGKILLKNEVTEISIKGGKVCGVIVKDSEHYESDLVVSNGDLVKTFFQLIKHREIDPKYLRSIKKMRIGTSFFFGFFGVADSLNLKSKRGWYHFSYGLNLNKDQSLYVFVPSNETSSTASKNKNVVEMAMPFPYDFDNIKDWNCCKQMLRKRMLNMAERIIPGISNSIEVEDMATPKTIEQYTSNTHGSMFGWEMSPHQLCNNRIFYDPPISGLHLVGHWTNPGCGVASAATSGWLTAKKIIQALDLKMHTVL
jgi:phytoene desaturase